MEFDKKTILLYGRTNAGKTAQIGEMAEMVYKKTGLKTRLYSADRGGIATIKPHIDLGIVEPILINNTDPFLFLSHAAKGDVRDSMNGKWVKGDLSQVGMVAYESFRSFAEELLMWQADRAAEGINIGGGSNISFVVKEGDDVLKIGGSNQSHYKVVQDRMTREIWQSQKLNVPTILWTSSVSKDDDTAASGKVLGPDVIGKALTVEVPRWFTYTFRLDVIPAQQGKPERHLLYMGTHVDVGAGNAAGLGNMRMPLGGEAPKETIIEPASVVKALEVIEKGSGSATEALKRRIQS